MMKGGNNDMKKLAISFCISALLLGGLAGCGNGNDNGNNNNNNNNNVNEGALGLNNSNDVRGYGGFSDGDFGANEAGNQLRSFNNDKYGREDGNYGRGIVGDNRPGMVDDDGILNDNDENRAHFNHRKNYHGENFNRNANNQRFGSFHDDGDVRDNGRRYNDVDQNMIRKRNDHRNNDRIRGQNVNNENERSYFDGKDGRLAREISKSLAGVEGIRNSHVIVYENDIIIGVEHDGNKEKIKRAIRNRVKKRAEDRDIHIVTDRENVKNIRGLNRRLESGEPFEALGETVDEILNSLGNAVQRPFEQTR